MIDISELHIGSHVLFNGARIEVSTLDALNGFIGMKEHCGVDADGMKFAIAYTPDEFDPIPITEELLKELGFVLQDVDEIELWNKTIIPKECNDPLISKFGISLRVFRYCGGWQVETNPSNGLKVNFLHEMESFVYLTTKKRLI